MPFTAHVHSDNSERLKAYGKKGNVKQLNLRKTNEKNIPPLLPGLAALEVVFIVVNDYKITNTYEEIPSSHRHFKKWSLFKVDSNTKRWRGAGPSRCPQSLRTHGREMTPRKRDMHHQCRVLKTHKKQTNEQKRCGNEDKQNRYTLKKG